ncbi:chemotaxis response regulator protein-glutamate methylesterase [Uliginosibacterium sediminicola]
MSVGMNKIGVLVVDDSGVMRALLSSIINAAGDMHVVAMAATAAEARETVKSSNPDVMTLDVEMPGMDGLDFLDRLMRLRPMPVVMISGLTARGSDTALKALELGALEVVAKPRSDSQRGIYDAATEICDKIRAAYHARSRVGAGRNSLSNGANKNSMASDGPVLGARVQQENFIMIGASTGGTEAIKDVLVPLPAEMPPILMVQHMPEMFTGSFAKRLDSLARVHVKEAEDGERIRPGVAYLAPGHSHLSIRKTAAGYVCALADTPPVNRHRPAVDVLFNSAASVLGERALSILLTGMGKDGAQGMLAMRRAGSWTVAQDEESSVVWGMPREAIQIGAACEVASVRDIPGLLLARLRAGRH